MKFFTKRTIPASSVILVIGLMAALFATANRDMIANIELDYLKQIHLRSPDVDPAMTPILLSHFINAKQTSQGIAFFKSLEKTSSGEPQIRYRASRAVLRAAHAENIFLLRRNAWVGNTIDMLNSVREAAPDNLLIRWMTGTTLAKLPARFDQQQVALTDLFWVAERFNQMPKDGLNFGTEKEVLYQLAKLHADLHKKDKADKYLAMSGYTDLEREDIIITSFAASANAGLTFTSPTISEVVPDRVYRASGFEMMDFYFVISEDGKETIAIDAGTLPSTAKLAHEAVMAKFPLPPISTVLVTHAHWDHIGGFSYFQELNDNTQFIARSNYKEQLHIIQSTPPSFDYFFSNKFSKELISNYVPDQLIHKQSEITIAGTRIVAIPLSGGETKDALAYHFPDHDITFVGDFIMPYVGAPFANEGDSEGLVNAIDTIVSFNAGRLLHGHRPLTQVFSSPEMLHKLGNTLRQLLSEVRAARLNGSSLSAIHQLNSIPQQVYQEPSLQLPYFVLREGFISRHHYQNSGYWQPNLQGMDYLSEKDVGHLLVDYLGVSKENFVKAISTLLEQGHYDAALKLSTWGIKKFPDSKIIARLRYDSLSGLRNKYQSTNPFKFLIYSESMKSEVEPFTVE